MISTGNLIGLPHLLSVVVHGMHPMWLDTDTDTDTDTR
jgi:hypothetical protein